MVAWRNRCRLARVASSYAKPMLAQTLEVYAAASLKEAFTAPRSRRFEAAQPGRDRPPSVRGLPGPRRPDRQRRARRRDGERGRAQPRHGRLRPDHPTRVRHEPSRRRFFRPQARSQRTSPPSQRSSSPPPPSPPAATRRTALATAPRSAYRHALAQLAVQSACGVRGGRRALRAHEGEDSARPTRGSSTPATSFLPERGLRATPLPKPHSNPGSSTLSPCLKDGP